MTPSIQIPIRLQPSRSQAALLFLLSFLFVLAGIWIVRDGHPLGYLCGGFFALGLPVAALQFHPKAAYLHLATDDFTFCSLFRAHTVRWEHVREFGVVHVGLNRMVAWNFTQDYTATGLASSISKSLSGYEAALPDTYGMNPHELVELMETLRLRYLETRKA